MTTLFYIALVFVFLSPTSVEAVTPAQEAAAIADLRQAMQVRSAVLLFFSLLHE